MILRLNTTELLDWQEAWCFECAHDHLASHVNGGDWAGDGCRLLRKQAMRQDVPEFIDHDEHTGIGNIPALCECTRFEQCEAPECQRPDTRLNQVAGVQQTHREWAKWLRDDTLKHQVSV